MTAQRILLVEHEQVVVRGLTDTLAALGHAVIDTVATGEHAIESARRHEPSVILMDVRPAGAIDGIEAAARIRAERAVPIVYVTGHADDETLQRAKATHLFGYVVKPCSGGELRWAIEVAIHHHETDTQLRVQRQAEGEIRQLNADLERQVDERTRQLDAAYKELEALGFSVAHDLRAPLRGIDGFSRALIEDHAVTLGPDGLAHVMRVRAAATRMTALIDDLVRLSRTTNAPLRPQRVDLSALAWNVKEALQTQSPRRRAVVAIQPRLVVHGDLGLIRIVIENLLGNAWKFTATRAVAEIDVGELDQDGTRVIFVRDNGVGFDARIADRLFGAFQRFHAASDFEGNGVGLAIVHRIVLRHGGRIWAASQPGAGATFYLAL